MKNRKQFNTSRRRALSATQLLQEAVFWSCPRHVLGRGGYAAPSDKLNIAGIGAGGRKRENDLSEFSKRPNVKHRWRFADVDDRRAKKSGSDFPKLPIIRNFREMLSSEKNNIDACSISTLIIHTLWQHWRPCNWAKTCLHPKPLTHDIYEARILSRAAKKYKVVTQMGNQGRDRVMGVRQTKEIYDAGMIGDVFWGPCLDQSSWVRHKASLYTRGEIWCAIRARLEPLVGQPPKYIEYNPACCHSTERLVVALARGHCGDMACHIMVPFYRILPIDFPDSAECSVSNVWKDMWAEGNYIR